MYATLITTGGERACYSYLVYIRRQDDKFCLRQRLIPCDAAASTKRTLRIFRIPLSILASAMILVDKPVLCFRLNVSAASLADASPIRYLIYLYFSLIYVPKNLRRIDWLRFILTISITQAATETFTRSSRPFLLRNIFKLEIKKRLGPVSEISY